MRRSFRAPLPPAKSFLPQPGTILAVYPPYLLLIDTSGTYLYCEGTRTLLDSEVWTGGHLFSMQGHLHALTAGQVLRRHNDSWLRYPAPYQGHCLLASGSQGIFISQDRSLRKFYPGTSSGWIRQLDTPLHVLTVAERLLLGAAGQQILAFDPKDGQSLWSHSGLEIRHIVLQGERIYLSEFDQVLIGNVTASGLNLTARQAVPGVIQQLVATEEDYLVATDSQLYRNQQLLLSYSGADTLLLTPTTLYFNTRSAVELQGNTIAVPDAPHWLMVPVS